MLVSSRMQSTPPCCVARHEEANSRQEEFSVLETLSIHHLHIAGALSGWLQSFHVSAVEVHRVITVLLTIVLWIGVGGVSLGQLLAVFQLLTRAIAVAAVNFVPPEILYRYLDT